MALRRQYKRSVAVRFGNASTVLSEDPRFSVKNLDDDGVRIAFQFTRTNRSESDKGVLRFWNLNEVTRKGIETDFALQRSLRRGIEQGFVAVPDDAARAAALKAISDQYLVQVFAGYDNQPRLVFRGTMLNVKQVRDGLVDRVTEVELGDGLLGLRDGYLNQAFAPGTLVENVLRAAEAAIGAKRSLTGEAFVTAVAPNAVVTQLSNGYVAAGRATDTIDEVVDLYGLQWWVRDGEVYYVPQGAVLNDFSVLLQQGSSLLDFQEPQGFEDTKGRSLLQPDVVPGRGLLLLDAAGVPLNAVGFRCNSVVHAGDTHGDAWYSDFEAVKATAAVVAPLAEFSDLP